MNLILLGAPGAGKGTQAQMVAEKYNVAHISTGDLFRLEVSEKTPLGLKAKEFMDRGELVPDEVVVDMIQRHLPEDQGFLLDGFPRTIEQAKSLDQTLQQQNKKVDVVISIEVPRDILIERLLSRGRSDDQIQTIENRLDVYQKQTKPLISFYENQNLIKTIDGSLEVEKVFLQIQEIVEPAV